MYKKSGEKEDERKDKRTRVLFILDQPTDLDFQVIFKIKPPNKVYYYYYRLFVLQLPSPIPSMYKNTISCLESFVTLAGRNRNCTNIWPQIQLLFLFSCSR